MLLSLMDSGSTYEDGDKEKHLAVAKELDSVIQEGFLSDNTDWEVKGLYLNYVECAREKLQIVRAMNGADHDNSEVLDRLDEALVRDFFYDPNACSYPARVIVEVLRNALSKFTFEHVKEIDARTAQTQVVKRSGTTLGGLSAMLDRAIAQDEDPTVDSGPQSPLEAKAFDFIREVFERAIPDSKKPPEDHGLDL